MQCHLGISQRTNALHECNSKLFSPLAEKECCHNKDKISIVKMNIILIITITNHREIQCVYYTVGMLRESEHSAEALFFSRMNVWVGLS